MGRISVMVVRALVVAVERAGTDRARFLADAALENLQFDDLLARIPLEDYRRAVDVAYTLTGDAALGPHMGGRLATGSFDALGHVSEHSGCLRDALLSTLRYARIVSEGPRLQLEERG